MCKDKSQQYFSLALQKQITSVEQLRGLSFDNPIYEEWRLETGRILDQIFGHVQSEQHPCTRAFLHYRIPEQITASRAGMQDYYLNILGYQADLLKIYLEDINDSDDLSRIPQFSLPEL